MTRSVVKHSYIKAANKGRARAKAHVNYIRFRPGKDENEVNRSFFTERADGFTATDVHRAIDRQENRGVLMHKLILSPGVEEANVQQFVRETMTELGRSKGLDLEWYAVEHQNTANPHAHVVVMATDKKGRQVRLRRPDYTKVKEVGDEYLERNRLLERFKEKEHEKGKGEKENSHRSLKQRLVGALKAAKEEFNRKRIRAPEHQKPDRLELLLERERDSLGEMPATEELAAKRAKQEERAKKLRDSAWQYYSTEIRLNFAGESVEYNWNSSLFELKKLQQECLKDGSSIRQQLTEDEYKRLDTWVNDGTYLEKRTFAQALGVKDLSLEVSAERKLTLTKSSSLSDMNDVRRMDRKGEIVLTPVEAKALELWIREQEKAEPITIKVPGRSEDVLYEKSDSREVLEFLADEYESGEKWTQGMRKKEYSKLRSWIKEKRAEELQTKQASREDEKDRS